MRYVRVQGINTIVDGDMQLGSAAGSAAGMDLTFQGGLVEVLGMSLSGIIVDDDLLIWMWR